MNYMTQVACRGIGSLFFCLLLSACAATPQSDLLIEDLPGSLRKPVELTRVPFYPQKEYQCGPAALATLISDQGHQVDLARLTERVYIPRRKGSLQLELVSAARDFGLIPYILSPKLEVLLHEVKAKRPVLVLQNLGVSWYPQWHYAVVVGYNLPEKELILRSGEIERYRLNLYTFEHTWRRGKYWAMILLKPGELPVAGDAWRYMNAIVGFEQQRNWPLLVKAYLAGLQRWPENSELLMGYGNALYAQGKLEKAVIQYEKVIHNRQNFAPAYNNAAQVYAELGQFEIANKYVRRAIELGGVHIEQYRSTLKDIRRMQNKK
jgi:tetratricopeptide (TPR) repeat protein